MSGREDWLERLQCLAVRFPQCGMGADLAGLALADLWGVYRFLRISAHRGRHFRLNVDAISA